MSLPPNIIHFDININPRQACPFIPLKVVTGNSLLAQPLLFFFENGSLLCISVLDHSYLGSLQTILGWWSVGAKTKTPPLGKFQNWRRPTWNWPTTIIYHTIFWIFGWDNFCFCFCIITSSLFFPGEGKNTFRYDSPWWQGREGRSTI